MGFMKRCCPSDFEPGESCSTSLEYIPPHPSAASRRVCRTTGPLSVTTLAEGCSIAVTIGDSTIGRHPLSLSVTSSQPLWTALAITWFDEPTNLDPHVIGSFNSVTAGSYLKLRDAIGWDIAELATDLYERPGPWLIGGVAIEQAGVIYVATQINWAELLLPNPCCWFGVGGGGLDSSDEPCRATRRAFADELPSDDEEVIGGSGLLCSDAFGRLMPDGTIDRDQRPDLNLGTAAHPVTRFGFVLGLSSCPHEIPTEDQGAEGTWSLAGVLGPICGQVTAHGAGPYPAGTALAPEPLGDLVIDEPLDSLPAGWTTSNLNYDDDSSHAEAADPATWSNRDDATFVESMFGAEYHGGTLSTTIPIARADWRDGARLTIEWTHRRIRDADRRYPLPGDPDPDEFNDQTSGIFVGGLFRWLMRHENASRYDEAILDDVSPRYGWLATGPVHPYGGLVRDNRQYTAWPTEWPYDAEEEPLLPAPVRWQLPGENTFDGRQEHCYRIAPNDGDRVTLTVDLSIQNVPNDYTTETLGDRIDVWIWSVSSYLNGRLITPSMQVSTSAGSFNAVPPVSALRIGLCAYRGGGWQDLKVWLSNP